MPTETLGRIPVSPNIGSITMDVKGGIASPTRPNRRFYSLRGSNFSDVLHPERAFSETTGTVTTDALQNKCEHFGASEYGRLEEL